ncbi:MAG: precorrin-3B C(17)-methyltransferase [Alphaproteobacteria bacterium]|nr:precorrin-3B C(17)-methyltransferase [Alphaproteobacteria bacterium]
MMSICFYHPSNQHPTFCKNYPEPYQLISDKQSLCRAFQDKKPIIGFCNPAILIRQLAHLLQDKWHDSPILAIIGTPPDATIITLLGGHHGGYRIAKRLKNLWQLHLPHHQTNYPAIDDLPENWLVNPTSKTALKQCYQKLQKGEALKIFADETCYLTAYLQIIGADANADYSQIKPITDAEHADIIISPFIPDSANKLHIIPPVLFAGLGFIRHADKQTSLDLLHQACAESNILPQSLVTLGTIDVKQNESALHHIADSLGKELRFFGSDALQHINVPNPSDIVKQEVGTASVCEASALLLAGDDATLCCEKIKNTHATCAIAIKKVTLETLLDKNLLDSGQLNGKKGGFLYIIGLGPGDKNYRLPRADSALAKADTIIGYQLYLDMVKAQFPHANFIALPLGQEIERAQTALDYAMRGHQTALLASGDAGIYALATLVMEQAKKQPLNQLPMMEVIPGITAMQMLSAKVGAPMGHDFCAISLSDLLTPRATIIERITAAAQGDFVVSFYNPQSEKRRDLLPKAIDILRASRPANTPIMVGRNLGRADESITISDLANFDTKSVDMFCVVMVGSSTTSFLGDKHVFTPRGYNKKWDKKEPDMKEEQK